MNFSMRRFIKDFLLTLLYGIVGFWLALPLSYFFQDEIYSQMSLWEYVAGGRDSILIGAGFGAVDVYRYTLLGCVIICILLGKLIESRLMKRHS